MFLGIFMQFYNFGELLGYFWILLLSSCARIRILHVCIVYKYETHISNQLWLNFTWKHKVQFLFFIVFETSSIDFLLSYIILPLLPSYRTSFSQSNLYLTCNEIGENRQYSEFKTYLGRFSKVDCSTSNLSTR